VLFQRRKIDFRFNVVVVRFKPFEKYVCDYPIIRRASEFFDLASKVAAAHSTLFIINTGNEIAQLDDELVLPRFIAV